MTVMLDKLAAQESRRVLGDAELRRTVADHARQVVRRYDWSTVSDQVLTVYEMAVAGRDAPVGEDPSSLRGARLMELRRGREPR